MSDILSVLSAECKVFIVIYIFDDPRKDFSPQFCRSVSSFLKVNVPWLELNMRSREEKSSEPTGNERGRVFCLSATNFVSTNQLQVTKFVQTNKQQTNK